MLDCITYSKNIIALNTELRDKMPQNITINEDDSISYNVTKTPSVRNGIESMALVRYNDVSEVYELDNLEILAMVETDVNNPKAVFDALFQNAQKTAIYDRVYDQTPVKVMIDGAEETHEKPRIFGLLA